MTDYTIIGSSGFIGSNIAKYLESKGERVFTPIKGDETIFEKELGKVIYCAGMTANYANNFLATGRAHFCYLLEILERCRFDSLVYLSSTRVYDGLSGVVDESTSLSLNPQNPRHLYDLTKVAAESLCFYDDRCRVARLGVVYDRTFKADIYPAQILRAAKKECGDMILNSSPNLSRDYVFLDDVIWLLLKVVSDGKSKIYNVASGTNIYNSEWSNLIERRVGCKISFENKNVSFESPVIDISLVKKEFDFKPKSFLDILESAC